jgi:large subunit ribosomal protein L15
MVIALHTIKPAVGATKKRKRVGRGNASGHGTYSGRGLKGQKSRSGVSGLKRLGMRQVLLRTPKKRGFKSDKPKDRIVNINLINNNFLDNDVITPASLYKKGLINKRAGGVKILGPGELKLKNLVFQNIKMSQKVREAVKNLGGQIE